MKSDATKLQMNYYQTDAVSLAKGLLGKVLVTNVNDIKTAGIICETEAYMGVIDRASHAYGGRRTARTETMYLPGGFAYVYLIYGMYYCMNVVAADAENPEAVLIRGILPLCGTEAMLSRRCKGKSGDRPTAGVLRHLTDGPGKLCTAMAIDKTMDKEHLDGDRIYICDAGFTLTEEAVASERINIDYAGEDVHKLWRFTVAPEDPLRRLSAARTFVLP